MSNLKDFVIENGVLKKYKGKDGDVVIPDGVISIGDGAFWGCRTLTSITIPNSVTSIGSSAFSHCIRLTSITIPNSVTSIGNEAFKFCVSLTSITIPSSVTSIGSSAFSYTRLTSITIPDSVTSIGNYAFYNFTSLTSIIIPSSVTSIGEYAFEGCTNLTSITIPNSVTRIGENAFRGCTNLTSIITPESSTINETIAKLIEKVKSIEKYQLSYGRLSDLDKWNNVILVEKHNFKLVDNELNSLIYDKYVSGKDAAKLFRPSAVKKLGKYCKLIHECYDGTIIYKQIPQSDWHIYAAGKSQNKIFLKSGFWEVEFNDDEYSAYSSIGLSLEFPREGFVWLPLRLRLNEGDIPTEKNLGGGEKGLSFANCLHESSKGRYHRVMFNVGKRLYALIIDGCYSEAEDSQITDYKIGQDERGYYIDVIIEMETREYYY